MISSFVCYHKVPKFFKLKLKASYRSKTLITSVKAASLQDMQGKESILGATCITIEWITYSFDGGGFYIKLKALFYEMRKK